MDSSHQPQIPDFVMHGLHHKGFSQTIVITSLWAVYLLLLPISLRTLFRHGCTEKINIILTLTTLTMFSITTAYFVVFLYYQVAIVDVMIGSNSAGVVSNFERLQRAATPIQGSRIIESLPRIFNFIFGDAIVVHRAFVLVGVDRERSPALVMSLRVIMTTFMVASAAVSIYDGYTTILDGRSILFSISADSNAAIDTAAISLSFATNFVATLCIAFTTWRQMQQTVSSTSGVKRVHRVLVLMTETAVVYCLIQFVSIFFVAIKTSMASAADTVFGAYLGGLNIVSALYPTILIIIVTRHSGSHSSHTPHRHSTSSGGQQWTTATGGGPNIMTLSLPSDLHGSLSMSTTYDSYEASRKSLGVERGARPQSQC